MNKLLTQNIISHILNNLLITTSNNYISLTSNDYLLDKKILFEEENEKFFNDVWGCQTSSEDKDLKLFIINCITSNSSLEYCLIVCSSKFPTYGIYFDNENIDNTLISVSVDHGKTWLQCNIYLQATFLAGMEQLKDIVHSWQKCQNYEKEFDVIKSFLNHHEQVIEVNNEG